jgi:hypothetical protein
MLSHPQDVDLQEMAYRPTLTNTQARNRDERYPLPECRVLTIFDQRAIAAVLRIARWAEDNAVPFAVVISRTPTPPRSQ